VRRVRRKRSPDVRIVCGLCVAEGKRRADVQLRIASGFGKDQCAGVQERRDAPGTLPPVMHALVDALSTYGIKHIDMPATPLRFASRYGRGLEMVARGVARGRVRGGDPHRLNPGLQR
jgi:hypothetical protein